MCVCGVGGGVERVRRGATLPSLPIPPTPLAQIPELRVQQRLGIKADMKTVSIFSFLRCFLLEERRRRSPERRRGTQAASPL